jgi:hypothetical protein
VKEEMDLVTLFMVIPYTETYSITAVYQKYEQEISTTGRLERKPINFQGHIRGKWLGTENL